MNLPLKSNIWLPMPSLKTFWSAGTEDCVRHLPTFRSIWMFLCQLQFWCHSESHMIVGSVVWRWVLMTLAEEEEKEWEAEALFNESIKLPSGRKHSTWLRSVLCRVEFHYKYGDKLRVGLCRQWPIRMHLQDWLIK